MDKDDFDWIIDSSNELVQHINEKYDKIIKLDLNFKLIKYYLYRITKYKYTK